MGRKRSGKRQHLFVAAACLMMIIAAGCAPARARIPEGPVCPECQACPECPACLQNSDLTRVGDLLSKGDFDGAMRESEDLLARSPNKPPGDEALMEMGLISAHYANPKKDYRKALGYFMRLAKEFPRSPLADEAKIWVDVLEAFEKATRVDLEIEEMKKGLVK